MKRILFLLLTGLFFGHPINAVAKTNPDIKFLRKIFISELTEQPVDEAYVKELMNTIQSDGSWPGINYTDTSNIGFQHVKHLSNLVEMSRAYKKKSFL